MISLYSYLTRFTDSRKETGPFQLLQNKIKINDQECNIATVKLILSPYNTMSDYQPQNITARKPKKEIL